MPPYMEAYICKYSHLLGACKRCASAQQNDMYASIYGGIHLYASIYGGIHLCIFPFTQCLQKVLIYGHVFTALNICIHIWRHACCLWPYLHSSHHIYHMGMPRFGFIENVFLLYKNYILTCVPRFGAFSTTRR